MSIFGPAAAPGEAQMAIAELEEMRSRVDRLRGYL